MEKLVLFWSSLVVSFVVFSVGTNYVNRETRVEETKVISELPELAPEVLGEEVLVPWAEEEETASSDGVIASMSAGKIYIQPSSVEMDRWFERYSQEYRVDINLLRKIAVCESGYNSLAVNGPYAGVFQFSEAAWRATRERMGLDADANIRLSAEESIRTAAFKISVDGTGAWPNCD